jgi:hypothetical protein
MRLMMGVLLAMAVGCNDKDTGDSDTDTGTDSSDPAEPVSVAGLVSGLFNGGVVLQLNGGFDVTVAEDGGFSFEDELLEADAFEVTVLTAPAGQSCEVVGGMGTADTDVTNVEVVCGCDFAAGQGDPRLVPEVLISDINALNFNVVTPLRGIDGTLDWNVSCGSETHTLLQSSDSVPDLEGTGLEDGTIVQVVPVEWSGNTAWALTGVQAGPRRGFSATPVLYRASPPSWQPQAVLYAGMVVDTRTIISNRSADVAPDGTVVGLVVVEDDDSERFAVVKVAGDAVSIAYDAADGVDEDGVMQAVCRVGDPVLSGAGQMAVPVTYGDACLFRGISDAFNGLMVVSDGQAARIVLGAEDVDPVAGLLRQIAEVQVDDVGTATLREWRCPEGARCIHREGGTGLVQVDLETGDVTVLASYGGAFSEGVTIYGINAFDVAPTGEVTVHLSTEDAACRRGGCAVVERVAWWDGALHNGVFSGQQVSGYVVDRSIQQVIATSSSRLGVVAGVWEGSPDVNSHDALMCWDDGGGSVMALGRATNDQTGLDVNTVYRASINESGNFAAVVSAGMDPNTVMILGSCP